ncbi:MAG: HIT domain-containing protein [Deltaproteobacteria bacterium]|nr:HIT domain-containing protein [Deltaproteobacteria bacterium]
MKQIWAPWRAEYVVAEKDKTCIFCSAASAVGAEDEGRGLVLFRSTRSIVMLNRFPYNSGHLMVAPVRHVARIEELDDEESADIFRLVRRSTACLREALNPQGFNIGLNMGSAAGAGIEDHIHMHVVPRWNGDMNFMPVLADVKVIPEHLKQTMKRLKPCFDNS